MCVFFLALAVYLAVPNDLASDDNYSHVLTAYSLVRGEWGRLDNLRPLLASPTFRHRATVLDAAHGGLVGGYGLGVALALVPVYAAAFAASLPPEVVLSDSFNQVVAAFWAALAVTLFWLAVRHLAARPASAYATVALALGSSALSLLSREVWQPGLLVLFSAAVLLLLVRKPAPPPAAALLLGGVLAGWAALARPTAVAYALAWLWAAWRVAGRRAGWFLAGLAPAGIAITAYNWHEFGSPFLFGQTIIGSIRFGHGSGHVFAITPLASLAGALFSPGRGFFVFSPVFVLVIAFLPRILRRATRRADHASPGEPASRRDPASRLVPPMLLVIAFNLLAAASWKEWTGGWTYGPRYLADGLVCWAALLAIGMDRIAELTGWRRAALWSVSGALLTVSVLAHAAGLLANPYLPDSYSAKVLPDEHPERVWQWHDFPPLYNLRLWQARHMAHPPR